MTDKPPDDPRRPPRNDPARRQDGQRTVRRVQFEAWDGPIPPPGILREINEVVPGAAKQIVDQFIAEGEHRREMEKRKQTLPFID